MIRTSPERDGLFSLDPVCNAILGDVDAAVLTWAAANGALAERHAELLRVGDLQRIDYFDSFPHLAHSVTPWLRNGATPGGEEVAGGTAAEPAEEFVLTSAACYGAYFSRAHSVIDALTRLTVRQTCRRREVRYEPLRRQREFQMREVVAIGPKDEVEAFLSRGIDFVDSLATRFGVAGRFVAATDPFFRKDDPRLRHQRMFPTKQEFEDSSGLAISSVNWHWNFFGERCGICAPDGTPVSTGCVAFGLERWVDAVRRATTEGLRSEEYGEQR